MTLRYRPLSHDFLYENPQKLMIMAANHDTERISDIVGNEPAKAKMVATLLATLRGIPQIFSGDELMFASIDRSQGHSGLRVDFPGGWPGDTLNLFNTAQRTAAQQEVFEHYKTLFQWRKHEPAIHHGQTMHFASHDNTYAYFRYNHDCAIFVFINASKTPRTIDWTRYNEILLRYHPIGKNVLTQQDIDIHSPIQVSSVLVKRYIARLLWKYILSTKIVYLWIFE